MSVRTVAALLLVGALALMHRSGVSALRRVPQRRYVPQLRDARVGPPSLPSPSPPPQSLPPLSSSSPPDLRLGWNQLKPFLKIAVPFFQTNKKAQEQLATVLALTLLNSGVSVAFSYVSRDFYNALNARDEAVFYEKIELFFAALLVAVPVTVYYRFVREKLSIYWREALTVKVLDDYYASRTFYQVESLREIDNPDQRIAEDVRSFTRTSLDFLITLLTSVIDLVSFSAILFDIYPPLFGAIIVYAGVGSVVTTNLGRSLVGYNFERLLREADFRFALIRTRENAEAIAFYDSDATRERDNVVVLLQRALETQLNIATAQRNLEVFTTSYKYLVQILPSLIIAPLYFAHLVELGTINQSYGAFNHILGDFSIIINQFESLSAFSAGLTRLSTFLDKIANPSWAVAGEKSVFDMSTRLPSPTDTSLLLDVTDLTVRTPDGSRTLIGGIAAGDGDGKGGIDFSLRRGDKLLVVGASGSGKSSFVRAVSGLWRVGSGNVVWYSPEAAEAGRSDSSSSGGGGGAESLSAPSDVFFLPQKPYNVLGSLRQQIMYPNVMNSTAAVSAEDPFLLELLQRVKLQSLATQVGGLDAENDWSKVLSLGEQQRLAFARVLYNQPRVVFLDGEKL